MSSSVSSRSTTAATVRARWNADGRIDDVVRVVAVDLDGTLLRSDGTVSPRTVRAIRQCNERGITVLLVTARAPADTVPVAAATRVAGTAICCLGAVVCNLADATVHHAWPFPTDVAAELVNRVRRIIPTATFGWVDEFGSGREPDYPRRLATTGLRLAPIDRYLTGEMWHIFVRDGRRQPIPTARLRAAVGDLAEFTDYGDTLEPVELTATGVNKGTALSRWCAAARVPADQVVAIGDSKADLPMFAWAGTSAVVGNAPPDIRAAADHVLPDNDSDGVAVFLEHGTP